MDYQDLLHKIIKEFHSLKEFKPWDSSVLYETLLRSVLTTLIELLGIDNPPSYLHLTTNNDSIGDLKIKYYGNALSKSINGHSMLQYLESKHVSILQAVVEIINTRSYRIKESYSAVFKDVSHLFEKLLKERYEAESNLEDYILQCLMYETQFYQGIVDNVLTADDTEKLASFLGTRLSEEDSMFSYRDIDYPLELNINNESLEKIYKIFLGVIGTKRFDIKEVASAVVGVYKRHQRIDHFEKLDSDEILGKFFRNILPQLFQSVTNKVFREFHKEVDDPPLDVLDQLDNIVDDFIAVGIEGVDLGFPALFRHYIKFMNEIFPTVVEDADRDFIARINSLIAQVLEFKDDEKSCDINQVVSEFVSLQSLLLKNNYLSPSTLLMRASTHDYYKNLQIVKITFDGWNENSKKILKLENSGFLQSKTLPKYLKLWYSKSMKLNELCNRLDEFYNGELCRKVWHCWRSQQNVYNLKMEVADKRLLNQYYIKWRKKEKDMKANLTIAVEFDHFHLLDKSFKILKGYFNLAKNSDVLAMSLFQSFEENRDSRIKLKYFQYWNLKISDRVHGLTMKLEKFHQVKDKFVLGNYFETWYYKHNLVEKSNNFVSAKDLQLLAKTFTNTWLKKFLLYKKAFKIEEELGADLKRKTFDRWKEAVQLEVKAKEFHERHLLETAFHEWKLKLILISNRASFDHILVQRCFQTWSVEIKLRELQQKQDTRLVVNIFQKWRTRQLELAKLDEKSQAFYESNMKHLVVQKWNVENSNIGLLEKRADRFFIRRFFIQKWQSKMTKYEDITVYHLEDEIATKLAYKVWRQRYFENYEEKLDNLLETMDTSAADTVRCSRYFGLWRAKLQTVKQIEERVSTSVAPSVAIHFKNWHVKSQQKQELLENALQFEEINLSRFLLIWFQRLQEVSQLEDQAEDLLAQTNFNLLRNAVHKWSMLYNKNIKRHKQLCEDFIARKETAKVRSIFDLWLYKIKEIEANTTIISNPSPLSKRFQHQREMGLTPQKKNSPTKVFTPTTSKDPSPTKLQETTQRMRNQNISALREHFGRARASSTPKKLSPVRLSYTNIPSNLRPPLPPKFDDSDIATAKSLGRIRPMVFPIDDQANFSPMDRTKLQSRNAM